MGWLFLREESKQVVVKKLLSDISKDHELIAHRLVGNHLWSAVRVPDGQVYIFLDLLTKDRNSGWGYRTYCEDEHPYYYDCPLSLIRLCSPPKNENSKQWRERVMKWHAAKKIKPTRGMVVTIGTEQYRLEYPEAPRRGWTVTRISDGKMFRATSQQIANAIQRFAESGAALA